MAENYSAAFVRITGRVQAVGFRVWTKREASKLGLQGWVRNEQDGSVLSLIVGEEEAISAMTDRFRQGPIGASVRSVVGEKATLAEMPQDFKITG